HAPLRSFPTRRSSDRMGELSAANFQLRLEYRRRRHPAAGQQAGLRIGDRHLVQLHLALALLVVGLRRLIIVTMRIQILARAAVRSEEHTSELQSRFEF